MPGHCKDTNWIIQAALDQMTPEMDHLCLLPSETFVKVTRLINVVRAEMVLRAEQGRCPPGSSDIREVAAGEEACEPPRRPTRRPSAAKPRASRRRARK